MEGREEEVRVMREGISRHTAKAKNKLSEDGHKSERYEEEKEKVREIWGQYKRKKKRWKQEYWEELIDEAKEAQ